MSDERYPHIAQILTSVYGKKLSFRYDPTDDTVIFDGVKFTAEFFRLLGSVSQLLPVGGVFRIEKREADGAVTIRRLHNVEEFMDVLEKDTGSSKI